MNEQRKTGSRRYTMGRRLDRIDETRERITAAAFELHATIGPSRTTISAIADRAGVQRHTVYRHFPDIDALYRACTEHGMRASGIPSASSWMDEPDPPSRLDRGLTELYAYYRSNRRMLENVLGDIDPTAPPPTEPDMFDQHMATLRVALLEGWVCPSGDRPVLDAVVTHAMSFDTWRSFADSDLSDGTIRDLLRGLAVAVAAGMLATGPV